MKQKICIIGAGNIGIPIAVDFSYNNNYKVFLYTKKECLKTKRLSYYDIDSGKTVESKDLIITDVLSEACNNSNLIIVTYPSFLIESLIKSISEYIFETVFFIPGYGGKDLISYKYLGEKCNIAGLDRAPYISRLNTETNASISKKKKLRLATLKKEHSEKTKKQLEELFKVPCEILNNYLTVNLTPSNPILHTSRIYSLLKDKTYEHGFERQIKFYKEWDNIASELMIKMDNELHDLIKAIPINLSEVIPLTIHYESKTVDEMTKKISGIKSFSEINAPLIYDSITNKYLIDFSSRYFNEDFPFGLKILIEYASICDIKTPIMSKIYKWFEDFTLNAQIPLKQNFELQNYGLLSKKNIIDFYSN